MTALPLITSSEPDSQALLNILSAKDKKTSDQTVPPQRKSCKESLILSLSYIIPSVKPYQGPNNWEITEKITSSTFWQDPGKEYLT